MIREWDNWLKALFLLNNMYDERFEKNNNESECKCEIIDIANEEMKNIDSTEIDSEFKKAYIGQITQNLIDLVSAENCEQKDIDKYIESIKYDDDILDIRVADKFLYIKTRKNIIPLTLSKIMEIDEKYIQKVPINGKYNFYLIDCHRCSSPTLDTFLEEPEELYEPYDPSDLVNILKDIGGDCVCGAEDIIEAAKIFDLVKAAFNENWIDMPENIEITVEIEDKVVAIALNEFIPEAKDILGEALFLNPKIFIEVSTPIGTVLLIDTRRWYLEPDFGGQEWFL